MDISDLRAKGAFVQAPPVPVEVSWTHETDTGEEVTDVFTVFVVKMSVAWVDRVQTSTRINRDASKLAVMISEGLRFGEGGKEKLSYEDACQLDPSLGNALLRAFNSVNQGQESASKNSQPPTSSGTS